MSGNINLAKPIGDKGLHSDHRFADNMVTGKANQGAPLSRYNQMTIDRKGQRRKTSDYYLVYNADTNELVGRVVNLSLDGAMLIGDHPVEVPTRVSCRMPLVEDIDGRNSIKFTAESRWSKRNEQCDWFETGYKFVAIEDQDRALVGRLTKSWLTKDGKKPAAVSAASEHKL